VLGLENDDLLSPLGRLVAQAEMVSAEDTPTIKSVRVSVLGCQSIVPVCATRRPRGERRNKKLREATTDRVEEQDNRSLGSLAPQLGGIHSP